MKKYTSTLDKQINDKNDVMNIIFRRGKKRPAMNKRVFDEYVKTTTRNMDQSMIGDEILRLEMINNYAGYQLPENIRIQKLMTINPNNDRVKKLAIQPTIIGSLNNLNFNMSGLSSRQLNVEYSKYQFVIDIATKNNLSGFTNKHIVSINMDSNEYTIVTLDDLFRLVGDEFNGLKNNINIYLKSIFASRALIFLYMPIPDILTNRLHEICRYTRYEDFFTSTYKKATEFAVGTPSIAISTSGAIDGTKNEIPQGKKYIETTLPEKLSEDPDENRVVRSAVKEFESYLNSFSINEEIKSVHDKLVVISNELDTYKKDLSHLDDEKKSSRFIAMDLYLNKNNTSARRNAKLPTRKQVIDMAIKKLSEGNNVYNGIGEIITVKNIDEFKKYEKDESDKIISINNNMKTIKGKINEYYDQLNKIPIELKRTIEDDTYKVQHDIIVKYKLIDDAANTFRKITNEIRDKYYSDINIELKKEIKV